MNQIRHFFRYEIPGYLSFIYVFIIVVSTLKRSIIVAYILPKIHSIALAGFLIAIPIGWFIYQIYDKFKDFHCHPKTLDKVKRWFGDSYDGALDKYLSEKCHIKSKKKRNKMKKIYYQQAIDIGIYSKKKSSLSNFEPLINNLSNKYYSYESRFIVGVFFPIISVAFLIIYCLFLHFCDFNFIISNSCRFWFRIVFTIIIVVISIVICLHKKTIYNAIQAQEDFLISIKKNKIKKVLETLLDED